MNTTNNAKNAKQARFDANDYYRVNEKYDDYINDLADMFAIAGGVKSDPLFHSKTKNKNKRHKDNVITKLIRFFDNHTNRH